MTTHGTPCEELELVPGQGVKVAEIGPEEWES